MKSIRTQNFKKYFAELPENIQELATKNYLLWKNDHYHPSLKFKFLQNNDNLVSVRIGKHFRALGRIQNNEIVVWHWIGSHQEYDKLI
jgi:mRNA-degrading endonuclease HigB of HigAB toxin-antitoxin module